MRSLSLGFLVVLASLAVACGGAVEDEDCTAGFAPACGEPEPAPETEPAPAPTSPSRSTLQAECVAPYHVWTDDARCVWSCSEGTEPDPDGRNPTADECVCRPGLQEVDTDRFGRRVCR